MPASQDILSALQEYTTYVVLMTPSDTDETVLTPLHADVMSPMRSAA